MKYVVGCDGGGTKTAVEIRDIQGNFIKRGVFGPMNLNGADKNSVQKTIIECIEFLQTMPNGVEDCEMLCIGSAGISNPVAQNTLLSFVKESGYSNKLMLVGDHETALMGALGENHGAVIIAGTGAIGFGKTRTGGAFRCGGYGHLIDDEGSGYAIGRDVLSAVVRAFDKRVSKTMMTEMLFETLGTSEISDIIKFVYDKQTTKKEIANLAVIAAKAGELGDESAVKILEKAAGELYIIAKTIVQELSLEKDTLSVMGSVLVNNAMVRERFFELLHADFPELKCILPKNDAATGAVLLALEKVLAKI